MADIYEQLDPASCCSTAASAHGPAVRTDRGLPGRTVPRVARAIKGCNDLLALTRPEAVREIHVKYPQGGPTSSKPTRSTPAYRWPITDWACAYEMSRAAAAAAARQAGSARNRRNPASWRFDGSHQPHGLDVGRRRESRGPRSDLRTARAKPTPIRRGDAGRRCRHPAVETIFDTLNAKAALYAIDAGRKLGHHFVMASGTLADASGRLSGQTVEAFCTSLSHAAALPGLNCAYGAKRLLPYLERLAETAPFRISAHPNAGL